MNHNWSSSNTKGLFTTKLMCKYAQCPLPFIGSTILPDFCDLQLKKGLLLVNTANKILQGPAGKL